MGYIWWIRHNGIWTSCSIGAQLAAPDSTVLAILGDGGFQMIHKLAVIREHNLPVKIVIINNMALGMVRQWQELFFDKRYSHSQAQIQPDFVKLADAFGIKGYCIHSSEEAESILDEVLHNNEPVLLILE